MTSDAGHQRATIAREHHRNDEFGEAAEAYTAAAYEYLGENGLAHNPTVARGLQSLLVAATCLRYLGRMEQCRNRCWQGVYITEPVAEEALSLPREPNAYDQSQRGVWYEFEADLRVVGDLPGAEEAYDRAEAVYVDAGDPETGAFEQFHLSAAVLPKQLVYGTDTDPEELQEVLKPMIPTLTDWIDFKRRKLPDILDRLDDGENWTYPF